MQENTDGQLNIELTEEIAEGSYSNLAIIQHSNAEFVIDFIRILPSLQKARVKSRVILAPFHAKRLLYALNENIQRYEQTFGEIALNDGEAVGSNSFGNQGGTA